MHMAKKHRVFIVEDHQLFREGLKSMLNNRGDIEIVGEAEDGLDAIRKIRQAQPEMVLLDLSIPKVSGISVMKEIKRDLPEIKILVLTIHESDQYVLEAFDAGVDGYCIKDASRPELMVAIDSVLQGKSYISPGISDQVIDGYLNGRKTLKKESDWDTVTQREREVLKLLAEGYSNKEIADFLHISVKTVEKHRSNLISKLDIHNVAQLTTFAIQKGLIEPEIK
ncbi:MAG: DNA-binding NarL/FixJ family response regulator [Desulforhopalus sp.]|jgi:DNA-binding NarL/FixJ family response regulator